MKWCDHLVWQKPTINRDYGYWGYRFTEQAYFSNMDAHKWKQCPICGAKKPEKKLHPLSEKVFKRIGRPDSITCEDVDAVVRDYLEKTYDSLSDIFFQPISNTAKLIKVIDILGLGEHFEGGKE